MFLLFIHWRASAGAPDGITGWFGFNHTGRHSNRADLRKGQGPWVIMVETWQMLPWFARAAGSSWNRLVTWHLTALKVQSQMLQDWLLMKAAREGFIATPSLSIKSWEHVLRYKALGHDYILKHTMLVTLLGRGVLGRDTLHRASAIKVHRNPVI